MMTYSFKWWMNCHIFLWQMFDNKRFRMYQLGVSQGFETGSSYWSARSAKKEIVDFIIR